MISANLQTDIHTFIICDLAIRAVNLDLSKTENFKLKVVFQPLENLLIKELYTMFYPLKNRLKKQQVEIVSWQSVDSFFSDVTLRTGGDDLKIRYAKKVLQYDVEQLILEALKTAARKWLS